MLMTNQTLLSLAQTSVGRSFSRPSRRPAYVFLLAAAIALSTVACSHEKEEEATVPVKAVTVQKTAIQRVIAADAVLFPLQQAALVPKITAPIKTFYVNRGAKVRKGQLLAVLENRDLAAAQEENKGAFEQAEAAYVTGTSAGLPEELQKATGDAQSAKEQLDAAQKLYDSRLELFKQGALPRKDLCQFQSVVSRLHVVFGLSLFVRLPLLGHGLLSRHFPSASARHPTGPTPRPTTGAASPGSAADSPSAGRRPPG